jgi:hypothetical protein
VKVLYSLGIVCWHLLGTNQSIVISLQCDNHSSKKPSHSIVCHARHRALAITFVEINGLKLGMVVQREATVNLMLIESLSAMDLDLISHIPHLKGQHGSGYINVTPAHGARSQLLGKRI